MPGTAAWSQANVVAVFSMWTIMMAAMMLPSALPMIVGFADVSARSGEPVRGRTFVAAYLALWLAFAVFPAHAQGIDVKKGVVTITDDAYVVDAEFDIALTPTLEEVLTATPPLE